MFATVVGFSFMLYLSPCLALILRHQAVRLLLCLVRPRDGRFVA
jgi:hypothetical protein